MRPEEQTPYSPFGGQNQPAPTQAPQPVAAPPVYYQQQPVAQNPAYPPAQQLPQQPVQYAVNALAPVPNTSDSGKWIIIGASVLAFIILAGLGFAAYLLIDSKG